MTTGATWRSTLSPSVAAFAPAARQQLTGRFDGLQRLGAVVRTTALTRIDGALDVGVALDAAGRSTTEAGGANPAIGYTGTTGIHQTTWIDRGQGVVARTRTTGTFDLRIESQGYPFLFPTFQTGPPAGQASAPFGGLIGAATPEPPTTSVRIRGSLSLVLDRLA